MKTNAIILTFLGLLAPTVFSSPAEVDVAASCGSLGVMNVNTSDLPAGVDPNNIRTCADHPVGSAHEVLEKRDCEYGAPVGCSGGYCWKQCGDEGSGQWCWTANNGGYGDWIKCSTSSQCNTNMACGIGDCSACGCSC
ncbi:hypothetical protein QBC38DRAFT_374231 [Podospora fimiseda]|uniref:IDI-2 n=1 Tax=Podospora fimiseda TaxID=252190 RepID=A0AAN7BGC5_9PEZI|nr:hypothetical protein QBC38DRAFT_374231 [Podospora fimiseda]